MKMAVASVVACAVVGGALAGAQPSPAAPVGSLALVLTSDRASYFAHAPVLLSLTAEHLSDAPGIRELSLEPLCGLLRFYVQGPAGERELNYLDGTRRVLPDGAVLHVDFECRKARLGPRQKWTTRAVVAFDADRVAFILDKPGEYHFVARYRESGSTLESNSVKVTVAAPEGDDATAFSAYSKDLALATQASAYRVDVTSETVQRAARFLEDHPVSPYTPLLREGLKEILRARGSRATQEERDLAARIDSVPPPVPERGRDREAYDAFTEDIALISNYGVGGDARALDLPAETILEAGRFLARFPDSTQSPVLRLRLWVLLNARAHAGTITPEETTLREKVKPRH